MKEQVITFETAKLAKKIGIDSLDTSQYIQYNDEDWRLKNNQQYKDLCNTTGIGNEIRISAPTQSSLQKRLREKHKIIILIEEICEEYPGDSYYIPQISSVRGHKLEGSKKLHKLNKSINYVRNKNSYKEILKFNFEVENAYEEALEIGLQEGLKLVLENSEKKAKKNKKKNENKSPNKVHSTGV